MSQEQVDARLEQLYAKFEELRTRTDDAGIEQRQYVADRINALEEERDNYDSER